MGKQPKSTKMDTKLNEQLKQLEQLAASSNRNLFTLGNASFWNGQPDLAKALQEIHQYLKKELQHINKPPNH